MNTKIKNIIFDLGNVILNFNKENIIKAFTDNKDEHDYLEKIFDSQEWQMTDLGILTNQEAADNINKRNNYIYRDLTEKFLNNSYKELKINRDTADIGKSLKEMGYRIYVLSNIPHLAFNYIKDDEFFKLCDGIVISAQEHIKKPDKRIFEILLNRYNLNPKECIFIDDDDTGRSYGIAQELGILGRRVLPNNAEDVKKMLSEYDIEIRED